MCLRDIIHESEKIMHKWQQLTSTTRWKKEKQESKENSCTWKVTRWDSSLQLTKFKTNNKESKVSTTSKHVIVAYNVFWNQWYEERQKIRHIKTTQLCLLKTFIFVYIKFWCHCHTWISNIEGEMEAWNIYSCFVTIWVPRSHSRKNNNKMIMCLLITFLFFMLCQKFKRLEKPQTLLKKPTFFKILIYQVSIKVWH